MTTETLDRATRQQVLDVVDEVERLDAVHLMHRAHAALQTAADSLQEAGDLLDAPKIQAMGDLLAALPPVVERLARPHRRDAQGAKHRA